MIDREIVRLGGSGAVGRITGRKLPGAGFESFVGKQIRDGRDAGQLRALPGAGKPLRDDSTAYGELWWSRGN